MHVPCPTWGIYINEYCDRLDIIIGNHFNDSHRLIQRMLWFYVSRSLSESEGAYMSLVGGVNNHFR